jgi:pimeloyl-ACP methyl ester carboxylesterase
VLIHGSLDRSTAFLRVSRELAELTVVRYDRRGYAKSLAVGPSVTFDDQVDDLASVVGDEPAIVAGHSLGGVVALSFAGRHPERALAVVAYGRRCRGGEQRGRGRRALHAPHRG